MTLLRAYGVHLRLGAGVGCRHAELIVDKLIVELSSTFTWEGGTHCLMFLEGVEARKCVCVWVNWWSMVEQLGNIWVRRLGTTRQGRFD